MISQIDNGQFQVYHSTRPGDPVPAFFTMGYRALEFPQNYLVEYLKARFLYELFKYGLIGKGQRELPDDDVRRKELNSVFNDCIGQYLFSTTIKNDGTPNLEDAQWAIIDNNLSTFSLASFLKKDKDEVDPDKIGDAYILGQLITEKESLTA